MDHFDSVTSEAYEMYHNLLNFCIQYELRPDKVKQKFKLLLSAGLGSYDRPLESALGQFLSQLDHINEEKYREERVDKRNLDKQIYGDR